jgi:hypothetical protein
MHNVSPQPFKVFDTLDILKRNGRTLYGVKMTLICMIIFTWTAGMIYSGVVILKLKKIYLIFMTRISLLVFNRLFTELQNKNDYLKLNLYRSKQVCDDLQSTAKITPRSSPLNNT